MNSAEDGRVRVYRMAWRARRSWTYDYRLSHGRGYAGTFGNVIREGYWVIAYGD